jgi:CRP/FNR family transcriptional regulator
MPISPAPNRGPLPEDHPCHSCDVRALAVCNALGSDDLERFRGLGATVRLAAGQPLFHQGDSANRVFSVTSGMLKLYKLMPDGRRQVIGFAFPGDFLGLAREAEQGCTAEALVDAQLCGFPRSRFDRFVEGAPEMAGELYAKAACDLGAAQEQLVLLGRKTALERLASFFVAMIERAERAGSGQVPAFNLPMSRADIADYLGLTKETVSRVLAELRKRRLVRLQALNRVEILDRTALAATAAGRHAL